jgi:hypothetical protein
MFKLAELIIEGAIDVRVAMAKQIDPPGADCIDIAIAIGIV